MSMPGKVDQGLCLHMRTHARMHAHEPTHPRTNAPMCHTQSHPHTHTHTVTHTHTHTRTHTHSRTSTSTSIRTAHPHTHTHAHTHTHTYIRSWKQNASKLQRQWCSDPKLGICLLEWLPHQEVCLLRQSWAPQLRKATASVVPARLHVRLCPM